MKPPASIPKSIVLYLLLGLILAAYALVRVHNLSQAVQKVKTTADTTSYMRIAQEPIFGERFLAGSRPPMFPMLLKLFRNDPEAVAWAQGILSLISWSILAVAVANGVHGTFVKFTAFGLILLLSLNRYIIGWDSVLLTESFSLSLLALFLAGWLWLTRDWSWIKFAFVLIVAFLWAFSRDTNAWVVLMLALFLLLLLGFRLIDRKYLILSIAFMLMFFLSNLSADIGDRWVFPFQNILGRRILPDAHAVEFFAHCGMPVSPQLMQLAGEYANSSDRAFYEEAALEEYRLWLHRAGKACYVKWLLSNPLKSIRAPWMEFETLIGMRNIQPFLFSKRFAPILPGRLEAVLLPRQPLLIVLVLMEVVVLAAVLTRAWTQNKTWWVVIGMNLLLLPHYWITWHGDVMGIHRHVVSAGIQFYLGAWLLVLLVLDRLLSFRVSQPGSPKPSVLRT